ncbi:DUF4097 domain-containing protein [Mesobacillus foraminis]|uniref:DUF4097 family beta strand repeat-containing protein n=1 Tax=Mesobacillus foraminis TaxID=279826 RepID=UPI001BEA4907|nr:DUF4097 domain-containing protein [Mesobacillus foraminis]MBT2758535.1 DUF4097 domain-containing protein [Mesobacillus foraminis]
MKEERLKILKMVEEGKLGVNEALFLIEELDKREKEVDEKKAELITELSTTVHRGESNKEPKKDESAGHKFQFAMDKVVDFMDTAFKKIKDVDLDLNFGPSIDINHIFQQSGVYLNQVDIDLANGSVQLLPWDKDEVRVECEAKVYRVDSQDQARRKLLEETTFAVEGQKLRLSNQQKWMKVNASIYIPAADYEHTRIRLFNGSIKSEGLTVKELKAKTASGKITLDSLECRKAETETANGQIQISRSHIDELEAETINGAINADGAFRYADLQSFSGHISCTISNQDCESIEAKGATGSIELYVPGELPVKGELRSNLGGFKLELEDVEVMEEKSEMVQKSLRFTSRTESQKLARIYADSKTGSVALKKTL